MSKARRTGKCISPPLKGFQKALVAPEGLFQEPGRGQRRLGKPRQVR